MSLFKFFRLIFTILAIVGIAFLFPVITALVCKEYSVLPAFLIPMGVNIVLGAFAFFRDKKYAFKFSTRDVFIFVALSWIAICISGSIPLFLSGFGLYDDGCDDS